MLCASSSILHIWCTLSCQLAFPFLPWVRVCVCVCVCAHLPLELFVRLFHDDGRDGGDHKDGNDVSWPVSVGPCLLLFSVLVCVVVVVVVVVVGTSVSPSSSP